MNNVVFERIQRQLFSSAVVVYMRGEAAYPLCSGSAAIVQILSQIGVAFQDVNIDIDPDIAAGIQEFSDHPHLPQLYIKGHFIGDVETVRSLYRSGELEALLSDKGLV